MLDDDGEIKLNAAAVAAVAAYCLRHRKKRFESDSNGRKQPSSVATESQTPFTNRPTNITTAAQLDGGTNATINMKKGTKRTHVPLAFVPPLLALKGGWFCPPGAIDSLGVVVDMVDVLPSTDF